VHRRQPRCVAAHAAVRTKIFQLRTPRTQGIVKGHGKAPAASVNDEILSVTHVHLDHDEQASRVSGC